MQASRPVMAEQQPRIEEAASALASTSMTTNGRGRRVASPSRLPLEIIEQIVAELTLPCIYGDPSATAALAVLACTNQTVRQCALHARYAVAVAPRHVRDFRKWITRVQRDMPGHNRALFVALDDVSKLTSMSAGWDVELLRLLQRLGMHLTHLSLWTSETQALLRDPAQIRGPRVRRTLSAEATTATTVADVMASNARRRRSIARTLRRLERGTLVQGDDLSAVPLKSRTTHDERQTRAEIAAARERARQKMPNWLRNELQATDSEKAELQRRYKAHLTAVAREYQHERDAAEEERRHRASSRDGKQLDSADRLATTGNAAAYVSDSDDDDDDDIDLASNWACMPLRLSLCPSLPLHEHEEPLNFARMTVFVRVEELDVFVSVPSEMPRVVEIFSSLVASPLRKLRLTSIYASLLIANCDNNGPFDRRPRKRHEQCEPTANIAGGLARVLRSTTLRSILFDVFHGRYVRDVGHLEAAIAGMIASCDDEAVVREAQDNSDQTRGGGLAASLCPSAASDRDGKSLHHNRRCLLEEEEEEAPGKQVQVAILQGDQKHVGKLKDRRRDFLTRALDLGPDCWAAHRLS